MKTHNLLATLAAICLLSPIMISAQTSGPNYPATTGTATLTGSTVVWSNPGNIISDNATYATVSVPKNEYSNYLVGKNFNFAIPAGATILGITAEIDRYATNNKVEDHLLYLTKDGSNIVGTDMHSATGWPATSTIMTYGGAANLWGTTWTPAEINNANFGIMLSITNTNNSAQTGYVDFIRITVTYSAPFPDECTTAIPLTVGTTCSYTTYTNVGATYSATTPLPGCASYTSPGGDVWFSVVVPTCGHLIFDTQTGGISDGGMAIYSGACNSLTLIECDDDDSPNGMMPMIDRTGLTPGSTVYIRFWEYGGDVTGTFGLCVYNPEPNCSGTPSPGATTATPASLTCPSQEVILSTGQVSQCGLTYQWQSSPDNVTWTNIVGATTLLDTVYPTSDTYYRLRVTCSVSGLTAYSTGVQVTVTGTAPANDDPCTATVLTVNAGSCSYTTATNECASASAGITAPGCASYSGGDVWFRVTVPASGRLIVDLDDAGLTDMGMAWYQGPNCGNLNSLIECDDDDSQNGAMPMICRTGTLCTVPGDCGQNATLSPGSTVWIRVWDYSGDAMGTFEICAYEPAPAGTPSTCATATTIASIPYSATGLTTCCKGNEYTISDGCASSYQDGEDYLFKYTPTANQSVDITLSGTSSYTGVFVTDRCPNSGGVNCIGQNTNSAGNPKICGLALSAGTTYYIMVDTDPTPNCTNFNISITASTTPSCALNYSISTIAYSASNMAGSTVISLPIDDRFSSAYIPIGFGFCYDGIRYSQLLVSSNAYLIFDPIGCSANLPDGNATPGGSSDWSISMDAANTTEMPRNAIMFPWQDTDPNDGGTISYKLFGVSPNRIFVVEYNNVAMFGSSCTAYTFTGQVKLFETTNNIEVHIDTKEVCAAWNDGAAILGLSNYNGTLARIPGGYNYSTPWTANNDAWRFTCGCLTCIDLLPIQLLSFKSKCEKNQVILTWTTASEVNNDYFTIEKSADAINWISVSKIKGAGNSNQELHYSATDERSNEIMYYRLTQTDFDGKSVSFYPITVNCSLSDDITIYPNPVTNILYISTEQNIRYQLYGSDGTDLVSGTEKEINMKDYSRGIYFLRVTTDDDESILFKVMKP